MTENAEEYMTGYEIAKEVNKRLEGLSMKLIPTQMVYNYMKQPTRLRKLVIAMKDGKKLVKRSDAMTWIESYVNGRIEREKA